MTLKDADKIKEAIRNSDDFVGGSDDILKVIDSVPEEVISTDTDTISRQHAIDALWEKRQALNDYMEILLQDGKMQSRYLTKIERNRIEEDINIIEDLPSAQPAPSQVAADIARIVGNENDMRVIAQGRIRGHWIPVGGALYQCDQCGAVSLKRKFCSDCGAEMDRGVTE